MAAERRAVVVVSREALRECLGVILDAGLTIVRTLEADGAWYQAAFEIAGDALPAECAGGVLRQVELVFTVEAYGAQRLVKLSEVRLTGRFCAPTGRPTLAFYREEKAA